MSTQAGTITTAMKIGGDVKRAALNAAHGDFSAVAKMAHPSARKVLDSDN